MDSIVWEWFHSCNLLVFYYCHEKKINRNLNICSRNYGSFIYIGKRVGRPTDWYTVAIFWLNINNIFLLQTFIFKFWFLRITDCWLLILIYIWEPFRGFYPACDCYEYFKVELGRHCLIILRCCEQRLDIYFLTIVMVASNLLVIICKPQFFHIMYEKQWRDLMSQVSHW